jgi:hypothetical protein
MTQVLAEVPAGLRRVSRMARRFIPVILCVIFARLPYAQNEPPAQFAGGIAAPRKIRPGRRSPGVVVALQPALLAAVARWRRAGNDNRLTERL